jgi:ankyrin repeat protein
VTELATPNRTEQFFTAIQSGEGTTVRTLLDTNPELVNATHESGLGPVIMATYCGRGDVVDTLLERGADLDIFAAAALGRVDQIAALLAEAPGLVNSYSADGWTPLHLAAHFGQEDALLQLLDHGANVDGRSSNASNNTAIHAAAAGRHRNTINLLLERGADVDAQQHGGFTALHSAAQHGDLALTELLVARGADVNLTRDDGQTPLAIARQHDHQAVAEALEEYGGQE